jgi:hypothetical protein
LFCYGNLTLCLILRRKSDQITQLHATIDALGHGKLAFHFLV